MAVVYSVRKVYYHDRDSVWSDLRSVRGGRALYLDGFDDGLDFKVAYAALSIDGSSSRCIQFLGPRAGDMSSGRSMHIQKIGPYCVYVVVNNPWGGTQYLDVGSDSEYASILPWKFANLQDLADHYDQVLQFVAQQPSGTYTTPDGKKWNYQVRAQYYP